jgi:hypothetical protein
LNIFLYLTKVKQKKMEELKNLQKKFMEIQKSGGRVKLSERTVVDIIHKVMNRNKIKINFTTNGKEYVTNEKIAKEISDEILRNKGRISKTILQNKIEIPSNIIETQINILFSKDKNLNLIEENIVTNYYLENMAREINDNLLNSGSLLISEISTMYDFSINFFKKFLSEKTGENKVIKGKLYPNRILTNDYINSQIKKIRPILIGSIIPVSLQYMIDTYKIDEFIINDVIQKLIDDKVIRGKVNSNIYEPSIFEESKISYIGGCLSQNNYLEYNSLKNIGIKNPKEFLRNLANENKIKINSDSLIFLQDFVITDSLKNTFEYQFLENYSKNISFNLNNIFLFEVSDADIFTLLDKIKIKTNTLILLNLNLIPLNFIKDFTEEISPLIKEEASKQYNNYINKIKEKEKKLQLQEKEKEEELKTNNINNKGGKAKKGKKTTKKNNVNTNDSEEEDDYINKNNNTKDKDMDKDKDINNNNISLSNTMITQIYTKLTKLNNLDDLFNSEETMKILFDKYIKENLNKYYSVCINEFISINNSKTKSGTVNDPKSLLNQIELEYFDLKLMQKAIDNLNKLNTGKDYQQGIKAIIAHLCKKDAVNLFKNILTYQLIHMKSKVDLNKINQSNDRKEIINSIIDSDIKEIFNKLNENISNKNLTEFMNLLTSSTKDLAISLAPFDKKKEKNLNEKYYSEFSKNLEEKKHLVQKGFKKDFINFVIDFGLLQLLNKNYFMKLPYENWVISVLSNLYDEKSLDGDLFKVFLTNTAKYVSMSDDDFSANLNDVIQHLEKLIQ